MNPWRHCTPLYWIQLFAVVLLLQTFFTHNLAVLSCTQSLCILHTDIHFYCPCSVGSSGTFATVSANHMVRHVHSCLCLVVEDHHFWFLLNPLLTDCFGMMHGIKQHNRLTFSGNITNQGCVATNAVSELWTSLAQEAFMTKGMSGLFCRKVPTIVRHIAARISEVTA